MHVYASKIIIATEFFSSDRYRDIYNAQIITCFSTKSPD